MPKGYSLHIGLQEVSPDFYNGRNGFLLTPPSDAEAFQKIAQSLDYSKTEILLTEKATKANFLDAIALYQKELEEGDIFLLTFSGHGGQKRDMDGDESDGIDETWCLYDGQIIDDQLYQIWHGFKAGVRIFVVADSCHSGSSIRDLEQSEVVENQETEAFEPKKITATIRLISSTQDDELAFDGAINSRFVTTLLSIWNEGNFEGNYKDFHRELRNRMPMEQSPNHIVLGVENEGFDMNTPFKI